LRDTFVWGRDDYLRAYLDLRFRANWRMSECYVRGRAITVEPGQAVCSTLNLAARWGWSRKKVRLFLSQLQAAQLVVIRQRAWDPQSNTWRDNQNRHSVLTLSFTEQAVVSNPAAKRGEEGPQKGHQKGHQKEHKRDIRSSTSEEEVLKKQKHPPRPPPGGGGNGAGYDTETARAARAAVLDQARQLGLYPPAPAPAGKGGANGKMGLEGVGKSAEKMRAGLHALREEASAKEAESSVR
jgi:hypothetical protein